jgi:hypothetical protein
MTRSTSTFERVFTEATVFAVVAFPNPLQQRQAANTGSLDSGTESGRSMGLRWSVRDAGGAAYDRRSRHRRWPVTAEWASVVARPDRGVGLS